MSYVNGNASQAQYSGLSAQLGQTLASEPRRPSVGMELETRAKDLEHLSMVLSQLEEKLSPIMSPLPPATEKVAGHGPSSGCAIISSLQAQGYQVDSIIQRVQRLIERVEL